MRDYTIKLNKYNIDYYQSIFMLLSYFYENVICIYYLVLPL